jgi:K+-sensing histidine kinase KdpD
MSKGNGLSENVVRLSNDHNTKKDEKEEALDALSMKYEKLKFVSNLKSRSVRHYLHNVMSPLSAASGYLELISELSNAGPDEEKMQRYSKKIEEGLNEVAFVLEQLHDMYRTVEDDEEISAPEVDVRWLTGEVIEIAENSVELDSDSVCLVGSAEPVHVESDLFQLKLIIYNLIQAIDQFATSNSRIEIKTTESNNRAVMTFSCRGEAEENKEFVTLFRKSRTSSQKAAGEDHSLMSSLVISHNIATQIKGEITLEAVKGDIPRIRATFPLAASKEVSYF